MPLTMHQEGYNVAVEGATLFPLTAEEMRFSIEAQRELMERMNSLYNFFGLGELERAFREGAIEALEDMRRVMQ